MRNIQQLFVALIITMLAACGGGGTLDSGGNTDTGGSTDSYSLTVTLNNAAGNDIRQVTTAAPGKLKATLKKNNKPISNQLIRFVLDGAVGKLSPTEGTARTDVNGIAEIQLQAGENPGSGQVVATYQVSSNETVTSAAFVFDASVLGGLSAELSVSLYKHDGTLAREVSHFSPGVAEAKLLIDGEPGAFQLIKFALGSLGVLNPVSGSAMTDANGIARIDVIAGAEAGASTLTATFSPTSNQTISASPYVFTTLGDTPIQGDETAYSINLTMNNQAGNVINRISNAQPGIVVATVKDSLGMPVVNKVVSFTTTLGRIKPAFGTALTNEQGEASVEVTAGTIVGAGAITARYQAKTQTLGFTSAGDEVISSYRLSLSLKNAANADIRTISRTQPGRAQAILSLNGAPVANELVTFTLSSGIGKLSPISGTARTNAQGVAELSLLAGEIAGSGQVNAVVSIQSEVIQSLPFVFDSLGDDRIASSLTISLLDQNNQLVRNIEYAIPGKLQALVTENGAPVAFRLVTFSTEGAGEINPTTGRAMTDANGIAQVDLRAGFVASSGEAQARYTNSAGAEIISDTFAFTSKGDTPLPGDNPDFTIALTLTDASGVAITEISQAVPGKVTARVLNKDGQAIVNQVVNFSSTLGRIQPAFGTALTDANGDATIRLTAGTVEGAGTLTARYQAVEQTINFSSKGNEILSNYLMTLTMFDSAGNPTRNVSKDNQGTLRAKLTFDGIALENQLVSFKLANGVGEIIPSTGTAKTDSAGVAEIQLFAGNVPGAGIVSASYEADDEVVISLPYVFESNGDQSAETIITAELVETATDTVVRDVNFANPRRVKVTLTQGGLPAAFKVVLVESRFTGVVNPSSGRVMTDASGAAYVDLLAGTVAGAGEIVAQFVTAGDVTIVSDAFTFNSAGDAPIPGDSSNFTIGLRLISSVTATDTSDIAANNSGQIIAVVRDTIGAPVINSVVSFSSTLGSLRPSTGTALTNAMGEARINILAGTAEGAGTVTAQYEGVVNTIGFYTRGDEVDPNQVNASINFRLLTDCAVDFRTTRNPNSCIEATSISAEKPGILFIQVTRDGSTAPLEQTLVSATTTIGSISPRTGTAITDSNGIALLDLVAGREVGAGEVSVTALSTTRTKAFEIGAVDVEIDVTSSLAIGETLAAGSTTLISVDITKDGLAYMPPLGVEFTSGCVQAGLAVIDQAVISIGGVARSTYRAEGCVGADLITATAITGGNTVSGTVVVDVSEAAIGSIEFLDVSSPLLALKGTGGANRTETSIVRFRLIDENGSPVAGRQVSFSLATAVGGLDLAQQTGFTNSDGIVQTVVRSGIVPTPTRVIAKSEQTVASGVVVVTAPSDVLTVSTGLADQNSFSLSRSAFNVHGLNFDGNEVDVSVLMADHFNNPVPDGTAVSFIAEGGSIQPNCTTLNGRCAVKWRSQNPRPFADSAVNTIALKCDGGKPCPYGIVVENPDPNHTPENKFVIDYPLGGRATILAYAIGEESFADLNGNGRFDQGEFVTAYDLTEAFIDNNEDSKFRGGNCDGINNPCVPATPEGDQFEEFIDFNEDGTFNAENGLYNGLLCREQDKVAGLCSRDLINVFQNQEIVMSGDEAYFRLTTYAADCNAIPGVTARSVRVNSDPTSPEVLEIQSDATSRKMCEVSAIDVSSVTGAASVSLRLFISDVYNNPLPVTTSVDISVDNGVLVGEDNYIFPNTTSRVPVSLFFAITQEPASGGNEKFSGFLTIKATTPSGLVSTLSVPVSDNR